MPWLKGLPRIYRPPSPLFKRRNATLHTRQQLKWKTAFEKKNKNFSMIAFNGTMEPFSVAIYPASLTLHQIIDDC